MATTSTGSTTRISPARNRAAPTPPASAASTPGAYCSMVLCGAAGELTHPSCDRLHRLHDTLRELPELRLHLLDNRFHALGHFRREFAGARDGRTHLHFCPVAGVASTLVDLASALSSALGDTHDEGLCPTTTLGRAALGAIDDGRHSRPQRAAALVCLLEPHHAEADHDVAGVDEVLAELGRSHAVLLEAFELMQTDARAG